MRNARPPVVSFVSCVGEIQSHLLRDACTEKDVQPPVNVGEDEEMSRAVRLGKRRGKEREKKMKMKKKVDCWLVSGDFIESFSFHRYCYHYYHYNQF